MDSDHQHVVESYEMSIHGKGLLESGLVVTATCANCHTAHRALPASDPASSVNPANSVVLLRTSTARSEIMTGSHYAPLRC